MSEAEKEDTLAFFKEVLRQATPQFDTTNWRIAREQLLNDIEREPIAEFKLHSAQLLGEVSEVIHIWEEKLNRLRRTIAYIEATDASLLTREKIANTE